MNKKKILITLTIFGLLIFVCMGKITMNIVDYFNYSSSFIKTQDIIETQMVQRISKIYNIDSSWISIREYVYCKSLHQGMTKGEVESFLSELGEIIIYEGQIDFKNRILSRHLGPINLVYQNGYLIRWRRSPDQNLGQPLATCEKNQ